jgi:hypothetical protein
MSQKDCITRWIWLLMTYMVSLRSNILTFFNIFSCSTNFITQKVYFSRFMRVYVGLIMLAAYFCHSCKSQVEYNCSLIKVDLLAACTVLH